MSMFGRTRVWENIIINIIGIVIVTFIYDDVYGNCDMCQTRDPGIEYQPVRPLPKRSQEEIQKPSIASTTPEEKWKS